jgi:hypothetical protein
MKMNHLLTTLVLLGVMSAPAVADTFSGGQMNTQENNSSSQQQQQTFSQQSQGMTPSPSQTQTSANSTEGGVSQDLQINLVSSQTMEPLQVSAGQMITFNLTNNTPTPAFFTIPELGVSEVVAPHQQTQVRVASPYATRTLAYQFRSFEGLTTTRGEISSTQPTPDSSLTHLSQGLVQQVSALASSEYTANINSWQQQTANEREESSTQSRTEAAPIRQQRHTNVRGYW